MAVFHLTPNTSNSTRIIGVNVIYYHRSIYPIIIFRQKYPFERFAYFFFFTDAKTSVVFIYDLLFISVQLYCTVYSFLCRNKINGMVLCLLEKNHQVVKTTPLLHGTHVYALRVQARAIRLEDYLHSTFDSSLYTFRCVSSIVINRFLVRFAVVIIIFAYLLII